MTDEQRQESPVSQTVSALALAYIDRALKTGKSVMIPSLGIVIEGDKHSDTVKVNDAHLCLQRIPGKAGVDLNE
jgi:hypothetical protein